MPTYIQAIALGFPNVQCHASGDGSVYENLVWDAGDPLPSKAELDNWIASNSDTGIDTSVLKDGTPARQYRGYKISLANQAFKFYAQTKGSRNFNLTTSEGSSSISYWTTPMLLTALVVGSGGNASFTVVLHTAPYYTYPGST